ncbi:MAG: hypothetical protein A2821_01545 [Candidatus Magasanikbacteria bacterium RIFCSPHIGHO2_01_FULL_41_23]|uniref:Uncharacterized protein n=1 Tax=Candidatus Magasanikbacteria bacterium RIFCSPLOWO2_01_FULL_40_15 TaxID=1798686 RepID=A0A1F6N4T5_9BACT|nr:MAG: hypothetical protein A2821_01545 [Candidatus Magasanikbacteria bacterium RIFCSPHIGHO2_01_FULL_41_23]OGH66804.1 MAG: hypothetical protein A3C66_01850 [Candidatus Magasanikbacteria bacterium RIFCSPHIGHO2_02_FULL_41_35]OGH76676.1 MAG: hypothetical protein A3F22_01075 [Candidatus Magasanikbacteria bacterium RIFCSPHIGHO2_12_FULL_41_16]OGH78891.1 MAG: hypothetical protein A2983_01005 [Candidatus Magasanikbacteria bacterium RIFCSPLOWO2_01_FULL_40_15]
MPFFLPVDFESALPENINGRLSDDQLKAIELMLRARKITGYILFFCELFQVAIAGPAFLFSEWGPTQRGLQAMIGIYAFISFAAMIWGLVIIKKASAAKLILGSIKVTLVTGTPTKYNYTTTYRSMGGATHLATLKGGWLSIAGVSYGVLPGELYSSIPPNEESDFYYITLPMTGFKKYLVVNFF